MRILLLVLLFLSAMTDGSAYKYYIADGPSMMPTIRAGERFEVDPDYYKEHRLERGDILVYHAPGDKLFIKR